MFPGLLHFMLENRLAQQSSSLKIGYRNCMMCQKCQPHARDVHHLHEALCTQKTVWLQVMHTWQLQVRLEKIELSPATLFPHLPLLPGFLMTLLLLLKRTLDILKPQIDHACAIGSPLRQNTRGSMSPGL